MDLKVLPGGTVLRISQTLGPAAQGCRLNTAALEEAVGLTEAALAAGADLLILNKFGKHEAAGRGFRPLIARAVSAGIPVLTGLNTTNRAAFEAFVGDMANPVLADADAIVDWAMASSCARLTRNWLTRS